MGKESEQIKFKKKKWKPPWSFVSGSSQLVCFQVGPWCVAFTLLLQSILSSCLSMLRGKRTHHHFVYESAVSFSPSEVLTQTTYCVSWVYAERNYTQGRIHICNFADAFYICLLCFPSPPLQPSLWVNGYFNSLSCLTIQSLASYWLLWQLKLASANKLTFICIWKLNSTLPSPLWFYCDEIYIFIHC